MRLQTALDRDMGSLQSSVVTAVSSEYKERHGNVFSLSVRFAFMLMMHKSTDCKRTVMPCESVNRHKRRLSEYVEFAMNLALVTTSDVVASKLPHLLFISLQLLIIPWQLMNNMFHNKMGL